MSDKTMSDSAQVRASGFYQKLAWKNTSKAIAKRDNWVCQLCGKVITGRYICDHIEPLTMETLNVWEIAFNPENLRTVHIECHNRNHARKKPKSNTSPDAMFSGTDIDFDMRDSSDKWNELREKYSKQSEEG